MNHAGPVSCTRSTSGEGPSKGVRRIDDVAESLPDLPSLGDDYPLLRFVDPYGETYFSSRQMAGLRAELSRLHYRTASEEDGSSFAAELEEMASECARRAHWFLVFIGE